MKLMSTTATILLAFCISCSTTSSIPEPGPSHPASSSAPVPAVAGPSDLLGSHDPLPQLSTQQAPDATEHDHGAMQPDQSSTEHDHGAMHADPDATETSSTDAHDGHDAHDAETEPVVYACPMHPDQRSNEPANCPICGMKMTPVEVESTPTDAHDGHDAHDAETEPVIYACPMHPDQRSNTPANCPICGMKMTPVEEESTPTDAHGAHDTETEPVVYACPMHPDQRSNTPANCPICGMKMKPVEEESTPTDAHDGHDAHDAETEPVIYACPMHPDQRSNAPADCPICGMKMTPVEEDP